MPRKPNYKFERFERERAKAAKKAARQQARADRKNALAGDGETPEAGAAGAVVGDEPADGGADGGSVSDETTQQ